MSFMGAGCKFMQDAGLKEVWSTVYKGKLSSKNVRRESLQLLLVCLFAHTYCFALHVAKW